jgi:hypothetical protein
VLRLAAASASASAAIAVTVALALYAFEISHQCSDLLRDRSGKVLHGPSRFAGLSLFKGQAP